MKPKTSTQYRQSVAARTGHGIKGLRAALPILIILAALIVFTLESLRPSREINTQSLATISMTMFSLALGRKPPPEAIRVTSLEDRADFRFGRPFDELARSAQQELLLEYQIGAFPLDTAPFGRPLIPTDPWYPERLKRWRFVCIASGAFPLAVHALYLHWPGLRLLRVLGSSHSPVFCASTQRTS